LVAQPVIDLTTSADEFVIEGLHIGNPKIDIPKYLTAKIAENGLNLTVGDCVTGIALYGTLAKTIAFRKCSMIF